MTFIPGDVLLRRTLEGRVEDAVNAVFAADARVASTFDRIRILERELSSLREALPGMQSDATKAHERLEAALMRLKAALMEAQA